jgi:cyclopropane-fatty-acyl-phospholipid synthase
MSLRTLLLRQAQRRLGGADLPLRIAFWDGETIDFAASPTVTITLRTPRTLRRLMTGNMAALGEAYVDGELTVDGRLQDVIGIGLKLADLLAGAKTLSRLGGLLARRPFRHSRKEDAAAISYHYDVSNEFYALWLDRELVYSCAYFRTGREEIDTAQEQKLDHICRKLRLAPGERLLDIGCGWGGLVRRAASHYGVTAVGVTLSERQFENARQRVAAEGLEDRVEIRLQDYRDIPAQASFDKIVSVGMYEHVGRKNLPLYFAAIDRLLKPGGLLLNHGITTTDRDSRPKGPAAGGEFIDRHVFPGGELPHLSRVLYEIAGQGLEVLDVEDLRPHYTQTLLHWVRRLEARKERAIELAGAPRYRIWRIYMAGMAYAFDRGWLSVCQVLAGKPARAAAWRPWTREYQYAPAMAAAPLAGGLDWGDL